MSAALVMIPSVAPAGAWTQPAGKFYARLAANRYASERQFDGIGDRRRFADHGSFRDRNLSGYVEYGLLPGATVVGSLAYKAIREEAEGRTTKGWGIGDIDLAGRFRLIDSKAGFASVQAIVKIPAAYDKDAPLPLGNGQTDVEARLLYGRSLWPLVPGYCNFEVGYRWRDGDPADEIRYLAEIGSDLGRRFYLRGKLDGIASRHDGASRDSGGNPTARNNFDLGRLDSVFGCRAGHRTAVELGVTPDLYGRTTAAGATVSIAVSYQNR